jgi:hypothetical protein
MMPHCVTHGLNRDKLAWFAPGYLPVVQGMGWKTAELVMNNRTSEKFYPSLSRLSRSGVFNPWPAGRMRPSEYFCAAPRQILNFVCKKFNANK